MKTLFSLLTIGLIGLAVMGCSSKQAPVEAVEDKSYYDRANSAASKAHDRLDRD